MYFVFGSEAIDYNEDILHAKLSNPRPSYEPHWWDCKPLLTKFPALTFTISSSAPMLDNYFTGTEFDLYSTNLIAIFKNLGVRFETFPAIIRDNLTQEVLPVNYEVFHLLESYDALDKENSDIDDENAIVRKLVLNEDIIKSKIPLFRIKELEDVVLIHENLKSILELKNCINFSQTTKSS